MLSERGQVQEAAYYMAPLMATVQKAFQWLLSYEVGSKHIILQCLADEKTTET